jgi:hypothetical protein
VYPARLDADVAEQKRTGAIAVVDLVGYKKKSDGSKAEKVLTLLALLVQKYKY